MPLIGVTTSEVRRAETVQPTPEGEPPRHEMALGLTYLRAIEAAGGIPVVIPPLHLGAIEPLLDRSRGDLPLRRTRPRPGDLRREAQREPRADRARPRSLRARDRQRGRPARASGAGDLPRHAGAQHRQGWDARAAHPRPHKRFRSDRPSSEQPRQRAVPSHPDRARQSPGRDRRRRRARGQLVPPPGDRSPGPRPDRHLVGGRRDDRGRRGSGPRVHDRCAVARRAAHRSPRGGGAVPQLRRGGGRLASTGAAGGSGKT